MFENSVHLGDLQRNYGKA